MDSIKINLTIRVPEDSQTDIAELKEIEAEFNRCNSLEEYDAAVSHKYNRKAELLDRVVDQLADTDQMVAYIKEAIRMIIRDE